MTGLAVTADIAAQLGMTENAIRQGVLPISATLSIITARGIAHTVATPGDIE